MTAGTVERKGKGRQRLRWYLFGPLTGIVAAVAVCYVCAALLEREVLPASTMEPLTIASLFVGAAAGGATGAKRRGGAAIETGLICGAVPAALVVVAALAMPGDGPAAAGCVRAAIALTAGGAFGGALCLDRGKSKRRKLRRGRR